MQRNSKNRRPNSNRMVSSANNRLEESLQRLITLNEAETNRMVPSTPDIPRLRLRKDRVYTASFSYTGGTITANSTAETTGAFSFQLSNVTGYTSWTSSFESYRIVAAYVEFVPFITTTTANNTQGQLATAIDYDDASPLFQMNLLQYDSFMLVDSAKYFERRVVPRAAKALYSGSAFTAYGQDTQPWIDTSSPSVPHYGIKYSQSVASSANTPYQVVCTLVVNFRNNA